MQGKNSLQTNKENLKNFGTDGNNLIHMERISNIDYKFEKDNTYDKTNFEAFDNCKSKQTDLSIEEEENEYYKPYFNIEPKKDNSIQKNMIFKIIYPRKIFSYSKNKSVDEPLLKSKFQKRKRCKKRQPRYTNQDNIRKVLKRRFTNTYLLNALNKEVKKLGFTKLLHKFPQSFAGDATKERNKEFMNMTLLQIFEENDSYEKQDLKNFKYNLDIVKKLKYDENMYLTLNKKLCELYEEYINSDEFEKEELNRLKKKKNISESYIQRYKNVALNFLDFCA
jgi:hypothetical protein